MAEEGAEQQPAATQEEPGTPAAEQPAAEEQAPAGGAPAAEGGQGQCELTFVIMPEMFTHTKKFETTLSIEDVKKTIEAELRIPFANIKLLHSGACALCVCDTAAPVVTRTK